MRVDGDGDDNHAPISIDTSEDEQFRDMFDDPGIPPSTAPFDIQPPSYSEGI